ncbi:unnamed protein product [Prunus armeniaca]
MVFPQLPFGRMSGWPIALPEVFRPGSFGFVKLPFQQLLDNFVHGFDLSVRLRVCWRSKEQVDLESGAELPKDFRVKLPAVIRDDGVGDAESAANICPDEIFDSGCRYCR